MLYKTHAFITNAYDCINSAGFLHDKSFLVNSFADFPDVVRVKKSVCYVVDANSLTATTAIVTTTEYI